MHMTKKSLNKIHYTQLDYNNNVMKCDGKEIEWDQMPRWNFFSSHIHKMKIDVNWNAKADGFFSSLLFFLCCSFYGGKFCMELRNCRLVANAYVLKPARCTSTQNEERENLAIGVGMHLFAITRLLSQQQPTQRKST